MYKLSHTKVFTNLLNTSIFLPIKLFENLANELSEAVDPKSPMNNTLYSGLKFHSKLHYIYSHLRRSTLLCEENQYHRDYKINTRNPPKLKYPFARNPHIKISKPL